MTEATKDGREVAFEGAVSELFVPRPAHLAVQVRVQQHEGTGEGVDGI